MGAKNPKTANTTDKAVKYRSRFLWVTTAEEETPDPDGAGAQTAHKLWGHNGSHELKMLQSVAFESAGGVGQATVFPIEGKTPSIENLLIENGKGEDGTPQGNLDYIKFDVTSSDSTLTNPVIRFTIKDDGDVHKYWWTLRVIDTNGLAWNDSATIRGKADQPGEIVVKLNDLNRIGQSFTNIQAGEFSQDKALTSWGTYTFDVFVAEVEDLNQSDPSQRLDYQSLKSPYKLQIPKERHLLRWESDDEWNIQAVGEYALEAPDNQPASAVKLDLIAPDLERIATTSGPVTVNSDSLHKKLIHMLTDEQAEVLTEINTRDGQGEVAEKRFIGVFMAEDSYGKEYRNHLAKHTLAVNSRPKNAPYISATKIDQDNPANVTEQELVWPASNPPLAYGGTIPSTADNLILQAHFNSPPITNGCRWYVLYKPFKPGASSKFVYSPDYSPPKGTGPSWNLNVEPVPGFYKFGCKAKLQNGQTITVETKNIEVGVRSDDVFILACFDVSGLAKPSTMVGGVSPMVLAMMPPTGPPVPATQANRLRAIMAGLGVNLTYIPNVSPPYAGGRMSWADRRYMMHWMLYFSADGPPPRHLLNKSKSHISYSRINTLVLGRTNYRCINHLQVKFRMHQNGTGFLNPPQAIRAHRTVGITKSPFGITPFQPLTAQYGPIRAKAPFGFYNAATPAGVAPAFSAQNTRVVSIVDGAINAPETIVANALRSLNLPALPRLQQKFVEAIGSQIRFEFDGQGKSVQSTGFYNSVPRYVEYHNGIKTSLGHRMPKAGGLALFRTTPYPFGGGTDTSITRFPETQALYDIDGRGLTATLPGGRYGFAQASKALRVIQKSHLVERSNTDIDPGSGTPTFMIP